MARLAIDKDFLDDYSKLPKPVQNSVKTASTSSPSTSTPDCTWRRSPAVRTTGSARFGSISSGAAWFSRGRSDQARALARP